MLISTFLIEAHGPVVRITGRKCDAVVTTDLISTNRSVSIERLDNAITTETKGVGSKTHDVWRARIQTKVSISEDDCPIADLNLTISTETKGSVDER